MRKIILNLLIFQIGWLVCVIGGNFYALIYTPLALLFHHWFVLTHQSEWRFVFIIAVIGCLWDSLMTLTGVISHDLSDVIGLPTWLICLWFLFATTFHHSLRWLSNHLWLAAVFAAAFGPLSYWAGSQLSSTNIGLPVISSLLIISAGWSLLFPAAVYFVRESRPLV